MLADLPPPPDLDPDPVQDFELDPAPDPQQNSAVLQPWAYLLFSLFLHYLIRNCFVKRTKNMMAKKKVIKIKGTVSRDLLALSFPLQSMPSGPLMNRLNWLRI